MHSCGSFQAYAVSDQFLFLLPKLNCSHSSLIILTLIKFQFTAFNDYSTIDVKGIKNPILPLSV